MAWPAAGIMPVFIALLEGNLRMVVSSGMDFYLTVPGLANY